MCERGFTEDSRKKLAAKAKIGSWVAYQNGAEENPEDPYLVGRLLDAGNGSPIMKQVTKHEKINGTVFTAGDYVMAVQWYRRDDADGQRLTFMEDPDGGPGSRTTPYEVLNSTELRAIDLDMTAVPRRGQGTS